jgi:hypothetical protein
VEERRENTGREKREHWKKREKERGEKSYYLLPINYYL